MTVANSFVMRGECAQNVSCTLGFNMEIVRALRLQLISSKCIHAGNARVAGLGLNREKTKMTGISPVNPFSRPLTHEWGQRERKERRGRKKKSRQPIWE